jgi:hypothetical protein
MFWVFGISWDKKFKKKENPKNKIIQFSLDIWIVKVGMETGCRLQNWASAGNMKI